jgi:hypothetical protein
MRRGGLRRYLLGAAIVLLLALVLAQVLLPHFAADRISSRVSGYGDVKRVHVSAWPALKLLWGDADSASVTTGALDLSEAQSAKLLWEARGINKLDATSPSAHEGPLRLTDVSLHKRGRALSAEGRLSQADLKAALPEGFAVQLLGSHDGQVEVRASGGLFGIAASVDAVAEASEGKLIAHPRGLLLEALRVTLFADPHVYVEGVGASAVTTADGQAGYQLTISASLR